MKVELNQYEIDSIYKMAKGSIDQCEKQLQRSEKLMIKEIILPPQPEWVEIEGVMALRIEDSKYIALPASGRKNSANFVIVDLTDRADYICQLTKKEVHAYLISAFKYEKSDEDCFNSDH